MSAGRRLSRILALQSLFELEARPGLSLQSTLERRAADLEEETGETLGRGLRDFAAALVEGALAHRAEIDARVARVAPAFPVNQLPLTDRVVLELAVYELAYQTDTPLRVVINEAVELAKTYGGENSGRFVNGVLGTIAEEVRASSPAPPAGEVQAQGTTEKTTRR
jgi:N utilization substance protein B